MIVFPYRTICNRQEIAWYGEVGKGQGQYIFVRVTSYSRVWTPFIEVQINKVEVAIIWSGLSGQISTSRRNYPHSPTLSRPSPPLLSQLGGAGRALDYVIRFSRVDKKNESPDSSKADPRSSLGRQKGGEKVEK